MTPPLYPRPLPEGQRAYLLDQALAGWVRYGARVEYRSTTWATIVLGEPINHVLHLLASVFLCGLWLPIWIFIAATNEPKRMTLSVDPWGRVHNDQAGFGRN